MKTDFEKAKDILCDKGYTCVLCKDDIVYTAYDRGVKPLLKWLDDGLDLKDFSAADKVVGKAAALLYVLLGVSCVYAPVMSIGAQEVFDEHKTAFICDKTVDAIINRQGDGFCPMETAVKDISSPETAISVIKEKLKTL